ncbi:MAG: sigma-70 family RNA polymerase sigma factor [Chitinophagales bacterium]|nr:sigma-70 family RNA polymerase sigma factor [Chitinophagales bacterium]
MKPLFNNDQELLKALRSQLPAQVNAALKQLCQSDKLKGSVRQQIYQLGGNEQDARDMLNQALLAFLEQVESGKYDPTQSAINTYVVKIATQKFYTQQRSALRRTAMHDRSVEAGATETFTDPEESLNLAHKKDVLDRILQWTGEKCRQLLQLHSHHYSHAEIAEMLQYRSADSAKMAVSDCRKKLNQVLTEHPELIAELRMT